VILQKAFNKYPEKVIKENLSAIYLAKEMWSDGVRFAGTYDQFRRIVYLADNGEHDEMESIEAFHHELSSILLKNKFFFLNLWYERNPKDFKYRLYLVDSWEKAINGTSLIGTAEDYEKGFMNSYGQTYFENDFNEYAAHIFAHPEEFKQIMNQYPRVRAKFKVWLDFYHEIDPIFTEEYLLGDK
jgi:hypothetical protein